MGRPIRIDAELMCRNLVPSRQYARELIAAGRMSLDNETMRKAARRMDPTQPLLVVENEREDYVSRGAWKLIGALDPLDEDGPAVEGVECLDADTSTGGFTDVLLRWETAHVITVNISCGQIAWQSREDPRVTIVEGTNVRTLDPALVAPAPDLVIDDPSFILFILVIPALAGTADPRAGSLPLVKPQFEVDKERFGSGGAVHDTSLHAWAMRKAAGYAMTNGFSVAGAAPSPLPRPAGNIEYFLYIRAGAADSPCASTDVAIEQAVAQGPMGENVRS